MLDSPENIVLFTFGKHSYLLFFFLQALSDPSSKQTECVGNCYRANACIDKLLGRYTTLELTTCSVAMWLIAPKKTMSWAIKLWLSVYPWAARSWTMSDTWYLVACLCPTKQHKSLTMIALHVNVKPGSVGHLVSFMGGVWMKELFLSLNQKTCLPGFDTSMQGGW